MSIELSFSLSTNRRAHFRERLLNVTQKRRKAVWIFTELSIEMESIPFSLVSHPSHWLLTLEPTAGVSTQVLRIGGALYNPKNSLELGQPAQLVEGFFLLKSPNSNNCYQILLLKNQLVGLIKNQ